MNLNMHMTEDGEVQVSRAKIDRRIEFHLARNPKNGFNNLINNNNKNKPDHSEIESKEKMIRNTNELFDASLVADHLHWHNVRRIGPGFYNLGNSCFMNSALQCLFAIPAFVQLLTNEDIKLVKSGTPVGVLGHLQKLVKEVFAVSSGKSIAPRTMFQQLRLISKTFRPMRQEDAHEYLGKLLDTLHEDIIKSYGLQKNPTANLHVQSNNNNGSGSRGYVDATGPTTQRICETTMLHRVFGGFLRNEMKCPSCKHCSRTYNSFLDLQIDVGKGINSVAAALAHYTTPETLTTGNEYTCEGCKKKVLATKQLTVSHVPNVLLLQLKRFSRFGMSNNKINKHIEFQMEMTIHQSEGGEHNHNHNNNHNNNNSSSKAVVLDLAAVLVHHGSNTHSGHYIAYVQGSNKLWYEMDDDDVTQVSSSKVQQQQAYVLFYVRRHCNVDSNNNNNNNNNGKLSGNGKVLSTKNTTTTTSPSLSALSNSTLLNYKANKATTATTTTKSEHSERDDEDDSDDDNDDDDDDDDIGEKVILPRQSKQQQQQQQHGKDVHRYNSTSLRYPTSTSTTTARINSIKPFRLTTKVFRRKPRGVPSLYSPLVHQQYLHRQLLQLQQQQQQQSQEPARKPAQQQQEHVKQPQPVDVIESKIIPSAATTTAKKNGLVAVESQRGSHKITHFVSDNDNNNNNNNNVAKLMLEESRRGRELGAEGLWEQQEEQQQQPSQEEIDMLVRSHRRFEQQQQQKRVSEWDQNLDRGREKKIKGKDDNNNEDLFNGNNAFQALQDRYLSGEVNREQHQQQQATLKHKRNFSDKKEWKGKDQHRHSNNNNNFRPNNGNKHNNNNNKHNNKRR